MAAEDDAVEPAASPKELPPVVLGLNAVILAVTDEVPRVLTVRRAGHALAAPEELALAATAPRDRDLPDALPFGPLDPVEHQTLDKGLRAWVAQQTGLQLGYVEQLYTFGDRFRDPRERDGGPRVVSAGYLALVEEQEVAGAGGARWQDVYDYLPWEDWRAGKPPLLEKTALPALAAWARQGGRQARLRRERVDLTFGVDAPWDPYRVLERYELLYEAGLVRESWVDRREAPPGEADAASRGGRRTKGSTVQLGRAMALDHRRILATALGRVRGKLKYRPVVFELLPPAFTLSRLQRVAEALAGVRLHKQNFRRLVEHGGLVEGTGRQDLSTGGRPAELFRFRREVLRERPAPGVGLPGALRG
ncbi:MAG TPA: hypothetical protein VGS57_08435 [Thermoanaerobaculia bacterium]|nr:hypothetical protein [Thermoanaerobaculia bacterium]